MIRTQVDRDNKNQIISGLSNLQFTILLLDVNVGVQNILDFAENQSLVNAGDLSIILNDFIILIKDQNFINRYKQSLTFLYVKNYSFIWVKSIHANKCVTMNFNLNLIERKENSSH